MISYIIGKVFHRNAGSITVMTASGVGYEVEVGRGVLSRCEEARDIELFIEMIVRETSMQLFGFESREELEIARELMKVQGIGAKTALAVLDLGYETLCQSVLSGDASVIMQAKGVGKAGARRVCDDLKKFVESVYSPSVAIGLSAQQIHGAHKDVVNSLKALGYKAAQVEDFLNANGGCGVFLAQEKAVSDIVSDFLKAQNKAA